MSKLTTFSLKESLGVIGSNLGGLASKLLPKAGSGVGLEGAGEAGAIPSIAELGYDANRLSHVFQAKHMLEALVAKLGSQEAALAAMHRAVQPLAKQGYQTRSWVTVKIGEHAVSIKGAVIDGVFKVSTATMRPF